MRLRTAHELLDEDEGTPAEVQRSLEELWWINRHLGGVSSWRKLWGRWLAGEGAPPAKVRLLDVGAGTGQMAEAHGTWLQARGIEAEVLALDRRASHLRSAGAGVVGDAFQLPFADGGVDLVTCNLFLHHFHDTPGELAATRLLGEMARVAGRAVLVNDLDRSWLPYLTMLAMGPGFSRITRHDGPRSVRQAYTRGELDRLARGLRAGAVETVWFWPYRLGMILRRPHV